MAKFTDPVPEAEAEVVDFPAPRDSDSDVPERIMLFPALRDDERALLMPVLNGTLKRPSGLHAAIARKANATDFMILAHQQAQFILYSGTQMAELSEIQKFKLNSVLVGLEEIILKVKEEGLPL